MDFLSAFDPSTITITPPHQGKEGEIYERKLRTYHRELQVHKLWTESNFDGFISVSSYDPTTFLPRCLNKLELCSSIAVYSPFREVVTELQNFIQTKMPTRPLIAPIIHELRAPRWSTLKGRARPDMLGRGGGGWILSGTKVEESEPEVLIWSSRRNKKRKINENGSEMEDVKTDTSAIETD
jgi:tRNA (adenine58-N1)-methyltransferase non-catalytic subunit